MRKSYEIGLFLGGLLLLGCGDEKSGPAVGPDLSWQYDCPNGASSECKTSSSLHKQSETVNIQATCRTTSAGLQITLTDPGEEPKDGMPGRGRSELRISNGVIDEERCVVVLTEYGPTGNKLWELQDKCAGNTVNPGNNSGTCVLEGEKGDGYGFNGTLQCEGMSINGKGGQDFRLSNGPDHEPISLQIVDC
jgi:hypothetical protein